MGLVVILGDLLANIVLNAAGSKLSDIKNKKDASNYAVNCPHCGAEVRKGSSNVVYYGTIKRECPSCHKTYIDTNYHEFALEVIEKGKARYDAGSRELEESESRNRLSDSGYIHLLSISDYVRTSPRNEEALRKLAQRRVKAMFDKLRVSTPQRFKEYRVHDALSIIDRLNYDARDINATTQVVRDVLTHYGINDAAISVDIVYANQRQNWEGGTLGTFTPIGKGGRIKIVMDPDYSEYDTVVAVILHECAHAFLHKWNICYPDKNENECFTDFAAIYMGGGSYLLRGYFRTIGNRVGYLSKLECEEAQKLVLELQARQAKEEADARRQAERRWRQARDTLKALVISIDNERMSLHPGRVVREASIVAQFQKLWELSEGRLHKAYCLIERTGSAENLKTQDIQKAAEDAESLASVLREFDDSLREWKAAETYQACLPESTMQMVQGIGPLVENGNAFAVLEMIRYWNGCQATSMDAGLYYRRLQEAGDGDSICALGLCSREGICTACDEAEARLYFQRAAKLGSVNAIRLLNETENIVQ